MSQCRLQCFRVLNKCQTTDSTHQKMNLNGEEEETKRKEEENSDLSGSESEQSSSAVSSRTNDHQCISMDTEPPTESLWVKITENFTYLMALARESLKNSSDPQDLIRSVRYPSPHPTGTECILLSCRYSSVNSIDFLNDFSSIYVSQR